MTTVMVIYANTMEMIKNSYMMMIYNDIDNDEGQTFFIMIMLLISKVVEDS